MHKLTSLVAIGALMAMSALPALAESAQSQTLVVVDSSISITVPALLDFGHGLVGAHLNLAANDGVLVITNNEAGYSLTMGASDMAGDLHPAETIAMGTDFNIDIAGEVANTPVAGENTVTADQRSDAAGDNYAVTGNMVVPFVDSGTYTGIVDFIANPQ